MADPQRLLQDQAQLNQGRNIANDANQLGEEVVTEVEDNEADLFQKDLEKRETEAKKAEAKRKK